jgi:hypothetical protein
MLASLASKRKVVALWLTVLGAVLGDRLDGAQYEFVGVLLPW